MKIGLIDVDGKIVRYVDGYGDKYAVDIYGNVYSMYRMSNIHGSLMKVGKPKLLKPSIDKKGYLIVNLYHGDGKPKSMKVHRLVALAFLENPKNKRCVCHKDNNPQNNELSNLYWGTDQENQEQAWKDGLHKSEQSVSQYDLDGNFIHRYRSQNEASRQTRIPQSNIWKCLIGERKTAGGFIWQR